MTEPTKTAAQIEDSRKEEERIKAAAEFNKGKDIPAKLPASMRRADG